MDFKKEYYSTMKKRLLMLALFLATSTTTATQVYAESNSLFFCRQMSDSGERLACYDKIVDSLLPANRKQTVAQAPRKENEYVPAQEAEALFGKSQAESKRIIEETMEVKIPDRIIARITGIKKSSTKKMTITLNNGQVWRQIDYSPIPLRNGDDIVIRSARLGSYLLQKHSGSGSIRVKRII